jgi:ATP-dependent DNA helicase MPH1
MKKENFIIDLNRIVLLVIDEAHRATGNYAYVKAIELMEKANIGFRIVSLSATPVSKIDLLQDIVNTLRVSNLEVRDDEDEEVKKYTHEKNIVEVIVDKENSLS